MATFQIFWSAMMLTFIVYWLMVGFVAIVLGYPLPLMFMAFCGLGASIANGIQISIAMRKKEK